LELSLRQFFAVIGHPVAHSLSPRFQQAAFDATGLDAAYLPFDILPETLPQALAALRILEVAGFNITLPHKEAMVGLVDEISGTARDIGAVNTVIARGGKWLGDNTDGPGFLLALDRFLGESRIPFPSHVLIFGAGGSARAVLWALASRPVRAICLVNRTKSRGETLLDLPFLSGIPERTACALDHSSWKEWLSSARAPLLINTLSLRAFEETELPFPPLEGLSLSHVTLYDLSYAPARQTESAPVQRGRTPFLKMGSSFGAPSQNGLGMLLCQGALAFRLWTGKEAPLDRMEEVLRQATGQQSLWESL
jgi:shikimate dehydrogenase